MFSQFLVFPVVPFITKFNRYIVLGLLVVGKFRNDFKAIPDGFSKKGQLHLQGVSCWVCGWKWRDMVPAYQEVVHYSPNWVTWANKEGLVGVVKHVDV